MFLPVRLFSVNWWRAALLPLVALVILMLPGWPTASHSNRATPLPIDAHLRQLLGHSGSLDLLVRYTGDPAPIAAQISQLGGTLTHQLPMINTLAASLPASAVPALARSSGVRWVGQNAPIEQQQCLTCISPTQSLSTWLQASGIAELANREPHLRGQGVTVAVIDSGIADHPDLSGGVWGSRIINSAQPRMPDTNQLAPRLPGVLLATAAQASPAINLDTDGSADWVRWYWNTGLQASRSTQPQLISSLRASALNSGGTSLAASFSSTNGTAMPAGTHPAVSASGFGSGFEFSVPADRTPRTLKIYVSVLSGSGRLEAFLSDGSSLPYIDETLRSENGFSVYTIVYNSMLDRQRLSVRWSPRGSKDSVLLAGAALANKGSNPTVNITTLLGGKDQYGHGTHVAGIIGGNGQLSFGSMVGVAPMVNLVNVRVNDAQGMATAADVVAGMQWVLENKDRYNIRVLNMSLNSNVEESYHTSALTAAAEILWFNGIVVVVSAGNNGNNGKLYPPANDPFVITVGATDDRGTPERSDDLIAAFSARGTSEVGTRKPEIVAPGVNIVSLNCTDCTLSRTYTKNVVASMGLPNYYFRASGTSMSAAVVSGVVALMVQRNPHLTPDQVKQRLIDSGVAAFGKDGPSYMNTLLAVTSSSLTNANTGLPISQALQTGAEALLSDSAKWGSAKWGSAKWGSVNWSTTTMASSLQVSVNTTSVSR